MALRSHPLDALKSFIPEDSFQDVHDFLHSYKIYLKITRERKSILGDYRPAWNGNPHTISVNGNLNKYHFLITFVHELAHLVNYLNHGRKVKPHGAEWKAVFATLLHRFIEKKIFPEDVEKAIFKSVNNLSASTCSDPHLYETLRNYDPENGKILVKSLQIGDTFITDSKKIFKIAAKQRTRFLCVELATKKKYLFPGIAEVESYVIDSK